MINKRNTAKEKQKENKKHPYKRGGKDRVKCEIWARSVGYLRPISSWNEGKKAEFDNRKIFEVKDEKS